MRTGRTPWHIDGQNPLACRRRQLQGCWRRILACRQTPSFWHIDDHSVGISTETIFFGMSTENFFCMSTGTIFFACRRRQSCLACRREQSFLHVDGDNLVWHVDGNIFLHVNGDNLLWHVDGNIFLHVDGGNLFCMSTETIFFACRRRQSCFGMSTGTTLLACRRSFWHVDASYPLASKWLWSPGIC